MTTANSSNDESVSTRAQQQMLHSQRAKEQQKHEEQKKREDSQRKERGAPAYFPLGYKEAAYQWWTSSTAIEAERKVLSYVPYVKPAPAEDGQATNGAATTATPAEDPYGTRIWRSTMVKLSGKNRALNEYSIERVGEKVDNNLVILHGYGAGLGFFYKNFEPLSRSRGWKLYALDMLGMGNSTRPHFRVKAKDTTAKALEAEDWFIDSLEEWRRVRRLDKFTLLAHSLGGYLAVSYALKYPGRLDRLILASPVGIPEDPYATSPAAPEPQVSTMQAEFTQDQASVAEGTASGTSTPAGDSGSDGAVKKAEGSNNFLNAKTRAAKDAAASSSSSGSGKAAPAATNPPPKRPLPSWLVFLWDANVSPFSLVRLTGPLGPRFVSGWTSRRFNHLAADESQALHEYSYSLFRQRGSGEYALPYILAPGAYARRPVVDRIADVGRQPIPARDGQPEGREHGLPIVFMYGSNDWMDVAGGYAAEEVLRQTKLKVLLGKSGDDEADREAKSKENGSAKVVIVQKAGHHLYIDNADDFNDVITREMAETRAQTLRDRGLPADE